MKAAGRQLSIQPTIMFALVDGADRNACAERNLDGKK